MTDAMLRLARAVYSDVTWTSDGGGECEDVFDLHEGTIFDPANNSEQFVEVLAWLLSPALSMAHPKQALFTVTSWNVMRSRFEDDCMEPVTMFSVAHNGTPAGIRAAVVEAAVRVAGGSA